ncbi:MAG: hypothetical protein HY903_23150 [Deltaproteobacteria bacterium]|nr:hypothetical protein [Deltaproteobacteria bacterium]
MDGAPKVVAGSIEAGKAAPQQADLDAAFASKNTAKALQKWVAAYVGDVGDFQRSALSAKDFAGKTTAAALSEAAKMVEGLRPAADKIELRDQLATFLCAGAELVSKAEEYRLATEARDTSTVARKESSNPFAADGASRPGAVTDATDRKIEARARQFLDKIFEHNRKGGHSHARVRICNTRSPSYDGSARSPHEPVNDVASTDAAIACLKNGGLLKVWYENFRNDKTEVVVDADQNGAYTSTKILDSKVEWRPNPHFPALTATTLGDVAAWSSVSESWRGVLGVGSPMRRFLDLFGSGS